MSDGLPKDSTIPSGQVHTTIEATSYTGGSATGPQVEAISAEFYTGYYPPPSFIRGYEDVVPGAAQQVLAEQQLESAHRRRLETMSVQAQIDDRVAERSERARGQLFALITGLILGVGSLIAGVWIACTVKEWHSSFTAALLEFGGIALLVKLFLNADGAKQQPVDAPQKASTDSVAKAESEPSHGKITS